MNRKKILPVSLFSIAIFSFWISIQNTTIASANTSCITEGTQNPIIILRTRKTNQQLTSSNITLTSSNGSTILYSGGEIEREIEADLLYSVSIGKTGFQTINTTIIASEGENLEFDFTLIEN